MKFFVSMILMAALGFAACLYLPWWGIAPASFLVGLLIRMKPGVAMLAGFLAIFLLWGWLSYWISSANGHILARKVSQIILKKDDQNLLILATALIGALVSAFAALGGSFLRSAIRAGKE